MRAKRNPQYDEMFLGGLVDRAKSFAEKRPGAAKAIGALGGMGLSRLIGGRGKGVIGGAMSGAGLMGMLGEKLQQRRNAEEVPQAEYGAKVKEYGQGGVMKYRKGGMFYAEDSDILQTEKDKNGTAGPSSLRDLFSSLEAVDVPEDYTEQEFIDVRGTARMGDQEVMKPAGGAFDRDVPQPLEFQVRKYGGKGNARSNVRFDLEDIQLGGVDEETGELIPNTITLPAEIYDMVEDGTIERKDIIQALGQSYSRSDERGRRAVPKIIRGEDPEPREPGPPGKGKIKIKKKREIRLPQLPYVTSPRYEAGRRPLFTPGQLKRVGRGG